MLWRTSKSLRNVITNPENLSLLKEQLEDFYFGLERILTENRYFHLLKQWRVFYGSYQYQRPPCPIYGDRKVVSNHKYVNKDHKRIYFGEVKAGKPSGAGARIFYGSSFPYIIEDWLYDGLAKGQGRIVAANGNN